jgi:hypothetical protein
MGFGALQQFLLEREVSEDTNMLLLDLLHHLQKSEAQIH